MSTTFVIGEGLRGSVTRVWEKPADAMSHTPGPWRLELVEDRSIKHLCPVDANDLSLLTIVENDGKPFPAVYLDADAKLIAAAPDLLEILIEFASSPSIAVHHPKRLAKARAAIAKATGEQPCS